MPRDLRLVACLLLFSTYIVCTVLGSIKTICPQGCECTSRSAHCRGDNNTYVDAVNNLPTSIENFTFTIFVAEISHTVTVDLSAANLSRLHNLLSFRIQPVSQTFYRDYTLIDTRNDTIIFCGLIKLKALHINTDITSGDPDIVNAGAVKCLNNLVVLDLSYTRKLQPSSIESIFTAPLSRNITTLLLRCIQTFDHEHLQELNFATLFSGLNRFKLEILDLAENAFSSVSPGLLLFPNLKKLDLSKNLLLHSDVNDRLSFYEVFFHPNLERFFGGNQELVTSNALGHTGGLIMPIYVQMSRRVRHPSGGLLSASGLVKQVPAHDTTYMSTDRVLHTERRIIQELKSEMLYSSACMFNLVFPIGLKLKIVNLTGAWKNANAYRNHLPQGRYCINPKNAVEQIDLSNNRWDQFLPDPTLAHVEFSGLDRLEVLNMRNNNLSVSLRSKLFSGLPSIHTLLLGGNRLQIKCTDSTKLPKTLDNIRILDLSQNQLKTIPEMEFSHLSKLEVLDLSVNQMQDFNIKLPRSPSFRLLDISSNRLTSLKANMTCQLETYQHLELNMQNNEFVCGCSSLHFVHWVQNTAVNLTGKNSLYCFTGKGHVSITKVNYQKLYRDCHPLTTMQVTAIAVSASICFFCMVLLTSYLYSRRRRIRYFFYRRRLRKQRADRELNDNYRYDAFVCYSEECREITEWIQDGLQVELEDKRGLRLFIPARDIDYGKCFVGEAETIMKECRKAILVLSPDYLRSWECMFEAWNVHVTMMSEDRDAVVLVKLQSLPFAGIPGTLTSMMEMRECFTWTEDPVEQEFFWERLAGALLSTSGSPINE